jgi:SAM-dependent methyltransferase
VPSELSDEQLLAAVYDPLDPDRSDLDFYAGLVADFGARTVVDIGCGTGTFACLLARRGIDVIGVDPNGATGRESRRLLVPTFRAWVSSSRTYATLPIGPAESSSSSRNAPATSSRSRG